MLPEVTEGNPRKRSDIERCKKIIGVLLGHIEASIKNGAIVPLGSQDWVWGSKRSMIDVVEILGGLLVKLHANDDEADGGIALGEGELLSHEDFQLLQYYLDRQKSLDHEE